MSFLLSAKTARNLSLSDFSATALLLVISVVFNQQPSFALPGENIHQSQQRMQDSSLFPRIQLREEEEWPINIPEVNTYVGTSSYDGGDAVFYMHGKDGVVTSELVQFYYPSSQLSFERDNETDLALIASLWGESVAAVFAASRYTDAIQNPNFSRPDRFYVGDKYGYQVSSIPEYQGNSAIYTFVLWSNEGWERSKCLVL